MSLSAVQSEPFGLCTGCLHGAALHLRLSVKISFRPVQNCSVARSSREESNTKKTGLFEVDIAVQGLVLIKDHTESKNRIRRPSHKKVYVSMAVPPPAQKLCPAGFGLEFVLAVFVLVLLLVIHQNTNTESTSPKQSTSVRTECLQGFT